MLDINEIFDPENNKHEKLTWNDVDFTTISLDIFIEIYYILATNLPPIADAINDNLREDEI